MAEELTLELLELQLTKYKKEDLQKKIDIAANIVKKCEGLTSPGKKCPVEKTASLTDVSKKTLKLIKSLEQKRKRFEDWLVEQRRTIHGYHFAYLCLRNHLIESYTKLFEIPIGLKDNKAYEGYKQFYTSLQLPGTRNSIVVEKPDTVLERHRFLYTKMLHRELDRHIVYIGKIHLVACKGTFSYNEDSESRRDAKSRFIIAASPKFGYLGYIYCCGNSQEYLTNWIQEKIGPELPRESVIIFQENVLGLVAETINTYSTKQQMINWLKSKEIPHDPTAHRADLYKLIKTYKSFNNDELVAAENYLRANGHFTLRKKKCNLDYNYFDPFWNYLIKELNAACPSVITQTANRIVHDIPLEYWKRLDDILIEKERQTYKEDLEMEHVIDQLMTMVKNEGLPHDETRPELDKYSKKLEEDHFFVNEDLIKRMKNSKVLKH